MTPRTLPIEPLTPEAFAPFGDVIAARADAKTFAINQGFATRFHDLARVDVGEEGGAVCVSIFQARPRSLPMRLSIMERHPLGSQAFVAMSELPFLVVVAPPDTVLDLGAIRCFRAGPGQGVNYARGVWHHPLIALERPSDFLVLDRAGAAGHSNLDEVDVQNALLWVWN
ncbi:ureidoglycolate lyase [Rhodoferax lacus]|uniref:Ureidoglycolate lyase n=1 Tax=Rhodoferax lacus TaxID=2184758 RepID=A0A3E1RED5_9BURK|nr:ureidoglycolate lyase [Rhodoferax lacus]RFO97727.1 ureidoglycolate lyase [Rhodoferax lacus]